MVFGDITTDVDTIFVEMYVFRPNDGKYEVKKEDKAKGERLKEKGKEGGKWKVKSEADRSEIIRERAFVRTKNSLFNI